MNSINHPYLVHHFLENSAQRLPDKVALICGAQRLTYQQINNFSNQLACRLIEMGVQRRDRVPLSNNVMIVAFRSGFKTFILPFSHLMIIKMGDVYALSPF